MDGARLRLGIVGAGPVTWKYHLAAVRGVPEVVAEFVVDVDVDKAKSFATKTGFRQFGTSHEQLFGAVDLAIVALPNHLHAPVSVDLLSRGIHVLCEKPMARTLAECQRMIAAAQQSGAFLAVGHNRRFREHLRLTKDFCNRGIIGQITEIHAEEGSASDWQRSPAYFDPNTSGGGALMDVGIHSIDLIRWIVGDFLDVRFSGDGTSTRVEDEALIKFTLENGATGTVVASRARELGQRLLVKGTNGFIEAGLWGDTLKLRTENGKAFRHFRQLEAYVSHRPPADSSFLDQLLNFVRAIRGEEAVLVDGSVGMAAVDVVCRAYAVSSGQATTTMAAS